MATLAVRWPIRDGFSASNPRHSVPRRRSAGESVLSGDRWLTPEEEADLRSLGVSDGTISRLAYREAVEIVELLWAGGPLVDDRRDEINARTISTASGRHPKTGHYLEAQLLHCPSGRWTLYVCDCDTDTARELEVTEEDGREKIMDLQRTLVGVW